MCNLLGDQGRDAIFIRKTSSDRKTRDRLVQTTGNPTDVSYLGETNK